MDENKNEPHAADEMVGKTDETVGNADETAAQAIGAASASESIPEAERTAALEVAAALPGTAASKPGGAPWPWIAVALLAIAALIFVLVRDNAGVAGGSANEVVGRMDGAAVTKADLFDELAKQLGEDQMAARLDNLMLLKLLQLEATSQGIAVANDEVEAEIGDYKKQYASDEAFETMLQQYGMTMDGLKEEVEISVKLRKIFEPQINPTEEQLKQFYEDNRANFELTPEQVRASHILLPTEEEAQAVLTELKQGADFAAAAKAKSTDEGTKDNGGDLDYFGRGEMDESFETAAFELERGQMSDVVESAYGFHIIKLTDKKAAVIAAYEEVERQVKNGYLDQEIGGTISDWIEEKKREYHYENLLTPKPEEGES